jgi:rod shape-determining protein MreD
LILYILSWFLPILFIIVKGGVENYAVLRSINLDIVIILIVYLLTLYGDIGVGIFAFCQGLIIDIFSGGMLGLFALLYLIIFFVIRIGSRPMDIYSAGGQMAVISAAVLLKNILMLIFLYMFSMEIKFSLYHPLFFIYSAVCSGLIAPLIFYLLNSVKRIYMGADGEI